jgi:hypothetical protein
MGQLILTAWLAVYVGILLWLAKIMAVKTAPRFLVSTATGGSKA